MASLKEVEKVADNLEQLVGELRSELTNGTDFEKLTQIADEISEKADNAAQTFSTVNETLMSRIGELTGKSSSGSRSRSSGSQIARRARPDGGHGREGRRPRYRRGGRGGRRRRVRAPQGADHRWERRQQSLVARVDNDDDDDEDDDDDREGGNGGGLARGSSLLSTVWDSASGSLMPLAEEAADAAEVDGGERARPRARPARAALHRVVQGCGLGAWRSARETRRCCGRRRGPSRTIWPRWSARRRTPRASSSPITVTGDEARLRQVIDNLLANTRTHTPAGTPAPGGGATSVIALPLGEAPLVS